MASRTRSRPEARKLVLGSDLRIADARAAFESLAGQAAHGAVEIDASQVARVDAAGLQALAAAIARMRASRVKCRWTAVSGTLAGAAALSGLARALGIE
jgi:anti-anti-sigma regulatory factor